jgi:hypothetical protein
MYHRNLPTLILALAVALFAANPTVAAPLSANEVIKLPSGHTAKILSVSKIEYSKGVMALMVRYQTSLSMDEAKAVSAEVDEVWKFAQKDVERAGFGEAIISSRQTIRGLLLTTSREANFIYEKGADGKWTRLERGDFMALE